MSFSSSRIRFHRMAAVGAAVAATAAICTPAAFGAGPAKHMPNVHMPVKHMPQVRMPVKHMPQVHVIRKTAKPAH
jgi:hypothetical protein